MDDPHCSEMEAIQSLHKKLDDDANGNIDISESTDVSLSGAQVGIRIVTIVSFVLHSSCARSSSTIRDTRTGTGCFTSTTTCTFRSVNCGRLGDALRYTTGR